MNTLLATVFADESAEYVNLQSSSPSIDLTDWECSGTPTTGVCGALTADANFLTTAPVGQVGYYELEFSLENNYWNCNFNFGNSVCGIDIRQGIAHMWDRGSFCTNSVVTGVCTPLDVPVPTTSTGGLPSPNPCLYDALFPQSGSNCVVGSSGGTAYHLNAATGANGAQWLYAPGSADLNAAAQHFAAAGVATSFNASTSKLTNPVTTNTPTFFIRSDSLPRKQLGESLAAQICHTFTGSYTQPCSPYLNTIEAPITACPGFPSCCFACNPSSWWMYTAAFSGPSFFDGSLYYGYNSRFVNGVPSIQQPNGPCSPDSVPTSSAGDYMYLCNPNYDSLSSQMEFSPCLTSLQDPLTGQPNNGPGGHCTSDPTRLSAVSAGIQAEATFGAGAFTIPLFELTVQFGYLNNGWTRIINHAQQGLPNHFTWLNAYNPTATSAWTIRQGFKETTSSVNPYIASTQWDGYIIGNIYDTLALSNPLNSAQLINWMTYTAVQQNNATVVSSSGYNPPAGTLLTYHFTLRNDLFFQDGRPVTSYDVAFSYLSMAGSGAFFGTGAASMTGITVLGPRAFDIGVNSLGVFTLPNLAEIPLVPARYWTGAGASAWDSAVSACTGSTPCLKTQYKLNHATVACSANSPDATCASFPVSLQQIDPAKIAAAYDPLANHIMVGSGPWQCGTVTSSGSGNCSSSGAQNPPVGGSYTLTRFGNGLAPASSTTGIYFRSSGDLALYLWTLENDQTPISAVSAVSLCFGQPLNFGSCAHWQHGIGASGPGVSPCAPTVSGCVGISQVSAVELRYNLNWVSPKNWATDAPLGIGALPPTLYEGSVTLQPCTIDPVNGYDC